MGTVRATPSELNQLLQKAREQRAAADILMAQPWQEGQEAAWETRTVRVLRDALGEDDDYLTGFRNAQASMRMPRPMAMPEERERVARENRNGKIRARIPMLDEAIREIEDLLERSGPPAFEAPTATGGLRLPAESFGFIADAQVREIVTNDYAELRSILALRATKSKLALSGSIVDGILMDALLRKGKTPAELEKLTLGPLIGAALAAGIITQQTADAAKPVKDYRNYLHTAVQLRAPQSLREVDADTSIALMRLVIEDLK